VNWSYTFVNVHNCGCHRKSPPQFHHMSLMDFVVSPPGCGRSVTNFWGWDAHEAQLRCPDEVGGGTWIWSTRRGLNHSSAKLPRPWPPWESFPSRKHPHGRAGNRTWDLMISSQKLRPLDHEAGNVIESYNFYQARYSISQKNLFIFYFDSMSYTTANFHSVKASICPDIPWHATCSRTR
jgi:hypothetical protein